MISTIFAQRDAASLKNVYSTLVPTAGVALAGSTLSSNLAFSNQLLGCRAEGGATATHNCTWGLLGVANNGSQHESFDSAGYSQSGSTFAVGGQRLLGNGATLLAGGIQYGRHTLSGTFGQRLSGNAFAAGLALKFALARDTTIAAALTAGSSNYTSTRSLASVAGAQTATGDQGGSFAAAHLRADRQLHSGDIRIDPFIDAGVTRFRSGELVEREAGPYDVTVAPHQETFVTVQSGVSLQAVKPLGRTLLAAGLDLSLTQVVGNAHGTTTATLAGAPAGIAPFLIRSRVNRTTLNMAPSLELFQKNGLDVKVGAKVQLSSGYQSTNFYLQAGTRF